jgi:putative ABC transport system permease protein
LYKVTGVIEDEGRNTHLAFEAVASMSTATSMEGDSLLRTISDSWGSITDAWVYIELQENSDPENVLAYMDGLAETHYGDDPRMNYTFGLQALTSIKPGPFMANEIGPAMPWIFVYVLGGLGLVILISSCFNYINLTIARSMNRSREVGVRKVSGATRVHVFSQFIVESVIICLVAFLMSILFLLFLEPAFSQLNFARLLQWKLSYEWWVWGVCILFTVLIGFVAGFFPAMTLSSFRPIHILGNMSEVKLFSRSFLRKSLIVVQFSLSLVFIITIMILYRQVDMMMHADLGFDNEAVLTLPYDEENFEPIRNELSALPIVDNVSRTSHMPATGNTRGNTLKKSPQDEDESTDFYAIDEYYLENMGIPLIAGRNISPRTPDQVESEVLLNESAVEYFGFSSPSEAIGELLYTTDTTTLTVVGVFPNYHHNIMVMKINPMVLRNEPQAYSFIQVKIATEDRELARTEIVDIWKKHSPGKLGRFMYLDERTYEFYDMMFGDLIKILLLVSVIACLIACLGLLGITVFSTQLRLKEVSIRKVLGAGEFQLFHYLSRGFLGLILISVLLALPMSWYVNSLWLERMAYRITLQPWYFVVGAFIVSLVALLTIGFQILRVIRVNPATSLRNE